MQLIQTKTTTWLLVEVAVAGVVVVRRRLRHCVNNCMQGGGQHCFQAGRFCAICGRVQVSALEVFYSLLQNKHNDVKNGRFFLIGRYDSTASSSLGLLGDRFKEAFPPCINGEFLEDVCEARVCMGKNGFIA
jgi:hypothetical protein